MRSKAVSVAVAVALLGCSTATKDIVPVAVSPMQYQGFTCDQLAAESLRLQTRATALGSRLDQAASNDQALGWVGALLFWPALFWLGGTKQQEAEFAMVQGEYNAVQQSAISKTCAKP